MIRKRILILFILCLCYVAKAQHIVDSLENLLASTKDTARITLLNQLSRQVWSSDPEKAAHYAKEAITLSKKLGHAAGEARGYNSLGSANYLLGNYSEALKQQQQALQIWDSIGDRRGRGASNTNIGMVYVARGDYETALKFQLAGLKAYEELNDSSGMSNAYNNIGMCYSDQGNDKFAIHYHNKALAIFRKKNNRYGIAASLNNIGINYDNIKNYPEALKYYLESLAIKEELGVKNGMANTSGNIASVYFNLREYEKSFMFYDKAIKLHEEVGDLAGLCNALFGLAESHLTLNNPDKALPSIEKGYNLANEIGALHLLTKFTGSYSKYYKLKGDYKNAFEWLFKKEVLNDSLLNKDNAEAIAEMQERFDSDKKEKQIELLTKDKQLSEAKSIKEKAIRNSLLAGVVFVIALAGLSYNRYRVKKKANEKLAEQKRAIEEMNAQLNIAHDEVRAKNTEITDSIKYAKRIQEAILPNHTILKNTFSDYFILYKPKDIVSGDFYWFAETSGYVFIAVADCTGHGVPGALMSMLGNESLHKAITEKEIYEPASILIALDKNIQTSLGQRDNEFTTRDGMDMALIRYDKTSNTIVYAGANRPLLIVRNTKELEEYKPNKFPIGGADMVKEFTSIELKVDSGDSLYLLSDGYADQIGGDRNKKILTKNLKQTLIDTCGKPMHDQQLHLDTFFESWRGNNEQVDDVLVVGVKI